MAIGFRKNAPPRNIYDRNWSAGTRIAFDENTAADHTVLAAQGAGIKIRVLAFSLIVAAANDLTWKSNTTAISGVFPHPAPILWEPLLPIQQYETEPNEALNLTLGGAVRVAGDIWVELVDVGA